MQASPTVPPVSEQPRAYQTPSFLAAGAFVNTVCQLVTPANLIAATKHSTVHKSFSLYYNRYVAIKIINKSSIPTVLADKFLPRELEVTGIVNHPNLVQCINVIQPNPTKVVIISEFCDGGTLLSYVMRFSGLAEFEAGRLYRHLADALHYLHDVLGVAHRDVKLENMLLDKKGNLKLADFGFARQANGATKSMSFCGTRPYSSPQLVDHVAYSPFAADWFASGITLYTMITSAWPHGPTEKLKYPVTYPADKVSLGARDLINGLLIEDERKRMKYSEVSTHMWLINMVKKATLPSAPVHPTKVDENRDSNITYHQPVGPIFSEWCF